jgi:hypothetical protein
VAEQLLASQEGLASMELVRYVIFVSLVSEDANVFMRLIT